MRIFSKTRKHPGWTVSRKLNSIGRRIASNAGSGLAKLRRSASLTAGDVSYSPGSIFAFVRWAANDHGTIASRIDILRAAQPGAVISTVPGVRPGGEILLRLAGWPKVERVLKAIDAIEKLGVDPRDVAPAHWSHLHNRISVGESPRAYSQEHHHAWLLRKKVDG